MRLSLDWMNLFGGLTASQITSVIVVAVIFTIASGLVLLSLIVFGVRAGLMAPTYSTRLPAASGSMDWGGERKRPASPRVKRPAD